VSKPQRRSLSRSLRTAQSQLGQAVTKFGHALSDELEDRVQEALRRRLLENAERLILMLPHYLAALEGNLLRRPGDPILLEQDGVPTGCALAKASGGRVRPKERRFGEPDKAYLALVRKALGRKVRVWVKKDELVLSSWSLCAAFTEWPAEHARARA